MKNCQELVDSLIEWLGSKISAKDLDGLYEITTPFLDRHNDHIQIYVKPDNEDNTLMITDVGYTITDLRMSGCDIGTESNQRIFRSVLTRFRVQLEEDQVYVTTTPGCFPKKAHNLIQAILLIDNLLCYTQLSKS